MEASKLLCTRMFSRLRDNSKNSLKVLSACVECVLWSAHDLQTHSSTGDNKCTDILSDVFDKLKTSVKEWIALKDVIGGSVFGASVSSPGMSYVMSSTWKGKAELEVLAL